MRFYYDIDGNDVSATVRDFLKSRGAGGLGLVDVRELFWMQVHNFWQVGGAVANYDFFLTSASAPLRVNKVQTTPADFYTPATPAIFAPTAIQRDSSFTYVIGFQVNTVDVVWMMQNDSPTMASLPGGSGHAPYSNYPLKWMFSAGYFRDCNFNIYQAVMLDKDTVLGITLKWRGVLRTIVADVAGMRLTSTSLLDVMQKVQVPTQMIGPGSRVPAYTPGYIYAQPTGPIAGSTTQELLFTSAIGGGPWPIPDGQLRDGFTIAGSTFTVSAPDNGAPPFLYYRIRDNFTVGGVLHVLLYEPILTDPSNVEDNFYLQWPIDSTGIGDGAPGFDIVPPPDTGV